MPGHREDLFLNPPLFAIPEPKRHHANRKAHQSARKFHLRRLNDIVHLCIQRGDLVRAKAAFAILARCREIEWTDMWRTGLAVVYVGSKPSASETATSDVWPGPARVEYLKAVIIESKTAVCSGSAACTCLFLNIGCGPVSA